MKTFCLSLIIALSCSYSYAQNTYPWPSSGNVGIGVTNPLTINSSAALFSSATPLVEMRTGTNSNNNPYSELITIRHSGIGSAAVSRQLGLLFKLSDETTTTETNKMGGFLLESGAAFANSPTFSLLTSNTRRLTIDQSGNVGIGTTAPQNKLDIRGGNASIYNTGSTSQLVVGSSTTGKTYVGLSTSADTAGYGIISSVSASGSTSGKLVINPDGGNVGIGITTPDAKLAVNGTIHTKEVKVDLTGWPDYIFKPQYELPPLSAVQSYIDQHQHLPELPSEQEVIKNGINLGEMNKLLVKKIEELTLYLIQKDKQLNDQTRQIQSQEERLKALEKAISKLSQ